MSLWPRLRRRSSSARGRGSRKEKHSSTQQQQAQTRGRNNPYSSATEHDDYVTVREVFQAERAKFAAEKGVPVSVVRYISRGSRGWVYLSSNVAAAAAASPSLPSSSGTSPHYGASEDEKLSSPSSTRSSGKFTLPPPALPLGPPATEAGGNGHSEDEGGDHTNSTFGDARVEAGAESSSFTSLTGVSSTGDPDSDPRVETGSGGQSQGSKIGASDSTFVGRDDALIKMKTTMAVLFVKVLVFSRALGASTGFALTIAVIVGCWNRSKGTFRRVLSGLASLVVSTLKPYVLPLMDHSQSSSSSISPSSTTRPPTLAARVALPHLPSLPLLSHTSSASTSSSIAPPVEAQRSSSASKEMKHSHPLRESYDDEHGRAARSSSFAFPVLARDPIPEMSSARFGQQPHQTLHSSGDDVGRPMAPGARESSSAAGDATAATSWAGSLPSESLKSSSSSSPSKSCQRLRSKFFKSSCSSPRKGVENSGHFPPSDSTSAVLPGSPTSSGSSSSSSSSEATSNPAERKLLSKESDLSAEFRESQEASTATFGRKTGRSHELSFFRSSSGKRRKDSLHDKEEDGFSSVDSGSTTGRTSSRSQELKSALRSIGRRRGSRSQELTSAATPGGGNTADQVEALPSATLAGLNALAFPFKEGGEQQELKFVGTSPPKRSASRRICSLHRRHSTKAGAADSGDEKASSSHRGSSKVSDGSTSPPSPRKWSSPSVTFSKFFPMSSSAESKPRLRKSETVVSKSVVEKPKGSDLRKIKTTVTRSTTPLPTQMGELGRGPCLSRELLGSLLLFAILGFLLLGRIPAILGTASLCLILSHMQRYLTKVLSPKEKEIFLSRRNSDFSKIRMASTSSPAWQTFPSSLNHGSPSHDKVVGRQSNDYRKRVLIEGFLDRGGHRRGVPS